MVMNENCDCKINDDDRWCEGENMRLNYIKKNISFQTICDGFT